MSTAASEILDYSPPPPRAGTLGRLGRNVWALGDQVLISGTNFLTGVLTARALGEAEFGTFAIVFAVLLFANILQSTLVTQAHNVLAATRGGRDYDRFTSSTAVGQAILLALEVALIVPIVLVAHLNDWASAGLWLALLPATVFWQLQEFARRVLYTERRHAEAFGNDLIAFGGQAALLVMLFVYGQRIGVPLTGATALYALAIGSAAGAVVGLWRIRENLFRGFDWRDLKESWHFGKWLTGGELMAWCYSLHMQIWWAALLLGVTASANLRAAQILFGPMRLISFFLGTVLPIRFARTLHAHGAPALRGQVASVLVLLAPTAGVYCGLLALFPELMLKLIFGSQYADANAAWVLRLFAVSAFLGYVQMVIVAALTAARLTRYVFLGTVWGCIIALVASPILIKHFGASGAIFSIIVTTLVVTVLQTWAYSRNLNSTAGAAGEGA
ncbi:MAG: polysaccharide biosynthesis C-terminal domain-containing protein [Tepidisphaeraceae bacterium]